MRVNLVESDNRTQIFPGYSFESKDYELKCIQFNPPVFKDEDKVEWVYMSFFELGSNFLTISPFNKKLKIPKEYDLLEIIFIQPKHELMPSFLIPRVNPKIMSIYAILFQSSDLTYIGTFCGRWSEMQSGITSILESKELPHLNIRVGILAQDDHVVPLEYVEEFFAKPIRSETFQYYLQMVVDSDDELSFLLGGRKLSLKGLSTLPKAIATKGAEILESKTESSKVLAIWRRLTVAAVNCGVVLPLLQSINQGGFDLNAENMMDLDLNSPNVSTLSTNDVFDRELFYLLNAIHVDSNEATWCRNFWIPLLNYCFYYLSEGIANFDVQHEVETRFLFIPKTKSKIDCAVTFKLFSTDSTTEYISLPVLIVEAGKETVKPSHEHKDSSKLYGMMSFACYTLAYELKTRGKRPELAVVYGMLIGGFKCQLLTAHAQVKPLDNGTCEIDVIVSYRDDWEVFLFQEPEIEPVPPEFYPTDKALKRVLSFVEVVKKRIDLILSDAEESKDDPRRIYAPRRDQASFSSARSSSKSQTPIKNQIITIQKRRSTVASSPSPSSSSTSPSSSPLKRRQRKHSAFEAQVYRQCAICFKNVFPRIYHLDQVQTSEGPCFDYVFELLSPLVHKGDFISTELFSDESPFDFIVACLRFHIHCLYGLYLLHEQVKIVHGDLKPSNIMYSPYDKAWKLIDFDHSRPIEESCVRSGGTEGFWAPECKGGTGLFTPASDIYSFGQVIDDVFFVFLMEIACGLFGEEKKRLELACFAMTKLMGKMKNESPEDRPTALEALRIVHGALNQMDPKKEINDFIIESVRILLNLKPITSTSTPTSESRTSEIPVSKSFKIAKIQNEKDMMEVCVSNLIQ